MQNQSLEKMVEDSLVKIEQQRISQEKLQTLYSINMKNMINKQQIISQQINEVYNEIQNESNDLQQDSQDDTQQTLNNIQQSDVEKQLQQNLDTLKQFIQYLNVGQDQLNEINRHLNFYKNHIKITNIQKNDNIISGYFLNSKNQNLYFYVDSNEAQDKYELQNLVWDKIQQLCQNEIQWTYYK